MKEKILLFWSGGKKSAMALELLTKNPELELVGLISLFDRETNRIAYHGIPDSIIIEQAKLLKLPLQRIFLAPNYTEEEYIDQVSSLLKIYAKKGIRTIALGDLEPVIDTRKDKRLQLGAKVLTPLSGMESLDFNSEFFKNGYKAFVTSVLKEGLGYNFLACEYNQEFLSRLPKDIDQAARFQEFHTFVIFGPTFNKRVAFSKAIAVEEKNYLVSLVKEP